MAFACGMDCAYLALYGASLVVVVYLLQGAYRARKRSRVVVKLRCTKCQRELVKQFRDGDFVGKIYNDICIECGGAVVEAIYVDDVVPLVERLFGKSNRGQRKT